jgi:DnaK suppressor protein
MTSSLEEQLAAERLRTLERIAALDRDRTGLIESSTGTGVDDEHDPEGATIAFERAQLEALLDQSRRQLSELDRSLRQLEEGAYGRCEVCGDPIAPERLAARPTASTCITCAARAARR